MKFKSIILLLLLLASHFISNSQIINIFGANINRGFISPHHSDMRYFIKGRITSFRAVCGYQTYGKKPWQQLWNYPEMGFGLYYSDLQNPDVLGNIKSAFFYYQQPILKSQYHGLYFNFDIGLAYFNKIFDYKNNYTNIAIGSHFNLYTSLFFEYQLRTRKIIYYTGIGVSHFSNGGTKIPNLGINIFSTLFGIKYKIKSHEKLKNGSLKSFKKHNDFLINQSFFVHGNSNSISDKPSIISTLSIDYGRNFNPKGRFGGGIDIFYDEVNKSFYESQNIEYNSFDLMSLGVHVSYNIVFNKVHVTLQQLYMIFQKHNSPRIYQRLGFRYIIGDNILLGFSFTTVFFQAQFYEPSIGIRF